MTEAFRVTVDHDTCSGTAHCQRSMPEVFKVINRKSHVRSDVDWSAVDIARLRQVVEDCPWFAIAVTETAAPEADSSTEGD
jgi:ferredoxin